MYVNKQYVHTFIYLKINKNLKFFQAGLPIHEFVKYHRR